MTDRTRSEKAFAQDALGVLFCVVGGFFAVSLVLYLLGQVPTGGTLASLTGLVVELAALLGAVGALAFSLGLAALGTVLFLRPKHLAAGRPFAASIAASLGVAFLLGAFGAGGALGAWLPGLLAGTVGRVLGAVLGAALGWLGWTLLSAARPARRDHADVLQRVGLATRSDAAGVSAAEAALLVTETRPVAPRPTSHPAAAPHAAEPAPVRDQTIRPYVPPRVAPAPAPAPRAGRAGAAPSLPAPSRAASSLASPLSSPLAPAPARPIAPAPGPKEASPLVSSTVTPPVPSWEVLPADGEPRDDERADLGADTAGDAALPAWPPAADPVAEEGSEEEELDEGEEAEDELEDLEDEGAGEVSREERREALALLAAEFDAEELPALDEDTEEAAEEEAAAPASEPPPRAAWEQIGLFDEEVEEEAPAAAAQVELTPTFDFDSAEPKKPLHEPEPEPEPLAPVRRVAEIEERPAARATLPAREPVPETARDVLVPAPAVRAEPVVTTEEESGRWSRLVFEAGCAILEQKRVAVSMLERRFGVDFDQACRVLDELQEAGLIGPYMGGRSRDILLTREEWLAHAPQAS